MLIVNKDNVKKFKESDVFIEDDIEICVDFATTKNIFAKYLFAKKDLSTKESIVTRGDISTTGNIFAGKNIFTGGCIFTTRGISTMGRIFAVENISATGNISARGNISTKEGIFTKGDISAKDIYCIAISFRKIKCSLLRYSNNVEIERNYWIEKMRLAGFNEFANFLFKNTKNKDCKEEILKYLKNNKEFCQKVLKFKYWTKFERLILKSWIFGKLEEAWDQ